MQTEAFFICLQVMLPQELFRLLPQLIADGLHHRHLFHYLR